MDVHRTAHVSRIQLFANLIWDETATLDSSQQHDGDGDDNGLDDDAGGRGDDVCAATAAEEEDDDGTSIRVTMQD